MASFRSVELDRDATRPAAIAETLPITSTAARASASFFPLDILITVLLSSVLKRKKRESSLEALLEDEETASKERLLEDLQGVSPQERAIQGEQQRQMMKLIAGLPVKLRTVVILYYYEDCSIREIVEATGSLAGTVKSRLYQARKLIREGLE